MQSVPFRPTATVFGLDGTKVGETKTPGVFQAPIRPDVVHEVHTNMNKNHRQPYGVKVHFGPSGQVAGHRHSAHSWGTGRAVARVPRVSGGGTHRSGQGAFANMCRGGRMFAPTKTFRRWHRKISVNQRRFATASALAASGTTALVMARGHDIMDVAEYPLVISADAESLKKTSAAADALEALGAYDDVERCADSRKIRPGKGKMRNRRHVIRRGPLIVYANDNGIVRAFGNLPGVEVANVDSLNLLQLAPGSHLGRFIIWTQPAFEKLRLLWGTPSKASTLKAGYRLPRAKVSNADIVRIINSESVQGALRDTKAAAPRAVLKKNPLTNLGEMIKLNPHAVAVRRAELLAEERKRRRAAGLADIRAKKVVVPKKKPAPKKAAPAAAAASTSSKKKGGKVIEKGSKKKGGKGSKKKGKGSKKNKGGKK